MATHTAVRSTHQTIAAASTAETITLNGWRQVEVLNRDASGSVYFTVDGSTPTAGGDETLVVPPGEALTVSCGEVDNKTKVTLISATSGTAYSVTGIA